jgi:hypothetical protein
LGGGDGGGGGGAGLAFSTDGLEGLPLSTWSGDAGLIRSSDMLFTSGVLATVAVAVAQTAAVVWDHSPLGELRPLLCPCLSATMCSLGMAAYSFFVGVSSAFGGVGGGGGAGGLSLMVNLEAPARTCLWSESIGRSSDIETTPSAFLGLMAQLAGAVAQGLVVA